MKHATRLAKLSRKQRRFVLETAWNQAARAAESRAVDCSLAPGCGDECPICLVAGHLRAVVVPMMERRALRARRAK